ncbi:hypothetical protein K7X08_020257 [Anisodus acutangulus]|uniref:Uncharacterized protein n=1 Tax=Anisodus acutangulus TaxID=402998 RepID=A0A9Q1REU0_9SOLA|nr:hypothetical protein K7X08_020257 [Anisodus acutangulus]
MDSRVRTSSGTFLARGHDTVIRDIGKIAVTIKKQQSSNIGRDYKQKTWLSYYSQLIEITSFWQSFGD